MTPTKTVQHQALGGSVHALNLMTGLKATIGIGRPFAARVARHMAE